MRLKHLNLWERFFIEKISGALLVHYLREKVRHLRDRSLQRWRVGFGTWEANLRLIFHMGTQLMAHKHPQMIGCPPSYLDSIATTRDGNHHTNTGRAQARSNTLSQYRR